jgi:predicted PurR-regulated permease PerM
MVESNYVTPVIVGARFTVNSFGVLLSVIFWSWLWGFFGALLAMPLVVVATTIYDAAWRVDKVHLPG